MTKPQPYTACEAETFGDEAPGVTIRWVIDEKQGSDTYAMRVIEIQPGGHTPHHTHWFEHQNFILEGEGQVRIGSELHPVRPGDVIFVPGDVKHQYLNTGEVPLKFICSIPMEWVREARQQLAAKRVS